MKPAKSHLGLIYLKQTENPRRVAQTHKKASKFSLFFFFSKAELIILAAVALANKQTNKKENIFVLKAKNLNETSLNCEQTKQKEVNRPK